MDLLVKGLLLGLTLAIMVGPILFAILQTALEKGHRAGLCMAGGVWTSDFTFIALIFLAFSYFEQVTSHPDFRAIASTVGGFVLLGFGLFMLFTQPTISTKRSKKTNSKDLFGYWLKGFILNTFNPFTVFFWLAIMTTVIGGESLTFKQALPFLAGLMGVIITTDSIKVIFAKIVRKYLKPHYILRARQISGFVLIGFGVFLLISIFLDPSIIEH